MGTNVARIVKASIPSTVVRPGLLDTVKRAVAELEHSAMAHEAHAKEIRHELSRFQQWASSPGRADFKA